MRSGWSRTSGSGRRRRSGIGSRSSRRGRRSSTRSKNGRESINWFQNEWLSEWMRELTSGETVSFMMRRYHSWWDGIIHDEISTVTSALNPMPQASEFFELKLQIIIYRDYCGGCTYLVISCSCSHLTSNRIFNRKFKSNEFSSPVIMGIPD